MEKSENVVFFQEVLKSMTCKLVDTDTMLSQ